jgi:hypothetical protein
MISPGSGSYNLQLEVRVLAEPDPQFWLDIADLFENRVFHCVFIPRVHL